MIRPHSFSDIFYPRDCETLKRELQNLFDTVYSSLETRRFLGMIEGFVQKKRILSFIVPHGAYKYSGVVSAFAYALIKTLDCNNFIILSSDHKGTSPGISITDDDYWSTPLGEVKVNNSMRSDLLRKSAKDYISLDSLTLELDYTIETQLPFIQFLQIENLSILPVIQKRQDIETSIRLGRLLSSIIPSGERVILISTSNLTHYLDYNECYKIDNQILSTTISMNLNSFYQTVGNYAHIICGYGCIASTIEFSRMIGNSDAIVLKHLTSGDVDGNKSSVVGYASLVMV
ncbi:AmmeMemoRadiSam system protein B [Candidatus Nitrosocosmicus franklandus]|uniref:MEMO1 family protein n=1 Tax=Candidatus Nitrosocosmicus franklandianus TaxID=1798806 RepID=A0A484IGU3_9ARCH|nr:AmmeMemoRadiSam system protein B [Candidatus Nitrosocosmicus franklandus]VFJ15242.1 conserved protein of unknown function [Candidatus Nitrosocosmicus franklandus]